MKKKIIFNINIKYKMQCKWEYKMQDQRKSFWDQRICLCLQLLLITPCLGDILWESWLCFGPKTFHTDNVRPKRLFMEKCLCSRDRNYMKFGFIFFYHLKRTVCKRKVSIFLAVWLCLLVVDVYLATWGLSKFPPLVTSTSVNNKLLLIS